MITWFTPIMMRTFICPVPDKCFSHCAILSTLHNRAKLRTPQGCLPQMKINAVSLLECHRGNGSPLSLSYLHISLLFSFLSLHFCFPTPYYLSSLPFCFFNLLKELRPEDSVLHRLGPNQSLHSHLRDLCGTEETECSSSG